MSSPTKDSEEATSSGNSARHSGGNCRTGASDPRPPAKRPISSGAVIEILDTESDDSDVCAVNSYLASADEVKRIRGAEYSSTSSSSSSSSDYSSDSESPWEDDSVLLEDKFPVKVVKAQLNPRASRMDEPKFNPALKSQDLMYTLASHWTDHKDYQCDEVTLTSEPFRLCLLHNILVNPDIINNIVDDMNTLDWSRKKMDLFEFHQTTDLANLSWQRSIRCIYQLLKTEVMQWVSQVTGMPLVGLSASCSLYGPGDHLLLHDDLLADRRVAFILYLAPWTPRRSAHAPALLNGAAADNHTDDRPGGAGGWTPGMGGALELFARDELGRPTTPARRVLPRNNTLAFFRVGYDSFHQVGEVLSLELPRLSINGWFHGPAPPDAPPDTPPPPSIEMLADERPNNDVSVNSATLRAGTPAVGLQVLLSEWLAGTYMCPRVRSQVAAQMERSSVVCLRELLQPARAADLLRALRDPEVEWEWCGAGQQRRYERVAARWLAAAGAAPPAALLRLAASAAFYRLLADLTDLTPLTHRRLELQRWRPGYFSLIPPRDQYRSARLEAVLYLGVPERTVCGGQTVYVAPEEGPGERAAPGAGEAGAEGAEEGGAERDGALAALEPRHNALGLVYCDAGAASFTKYLSRLTMRPDECFYILTCSYCE